MRKVLTIALKKYSTSFSFLFFLILCFLCPLLLSQQTSHRVVMEVAEVCVVDVSGSPGLLRVVPPGNSESEGQNAVDNSAFLHYTSTVSSQRRRRITVRWQDMDSSPAGCCLILEAVLSGNRNEGMPAGQIILSQEEQILITGIDSCATGTGQTEGARLVYRLVIRDAERLIPGERRAATVVFTLTDST